MLLSKGFKEMKRNSAILLLAASLTAGVLTEARAISYVDWTWANQDAGIARGTITLPDSSTVEVTHTGEVVETSQITGGLNYWTTDVSPDPSPYLNSVVTSLPTTADMIALSHDIRNTITFSKPVTDPVMLILSLGRPDWDEVTYFFDAPVEILSSGRGHWGGDPAGSLFKLGDNAVYGVEGHGAIQFKGTFTSISWDVNWDEFWHGFTIALPDQPHRVPDHLGLSGLALAALSIAGLGLAQKRGMLRRTQS